MVLPFGFSVGDFVAVGALAYKVANALSESRGSVAQHSSLIELLGSIETSLRSVSEFLKSPPSTEIFKLDKAFVNGVLYHTSCCQKLLDQFWTDSQKYTQSFLKQKGKFLQREWRKIQWTIFKDEDARKLEQRLQGHFNAFQTYLIAINVQLQIQSTTKSEGQLTRIDRRLSEVVNFIHQSKHRQPKNLGYPWQGDNGGRNVFLEDMLGRAHEIPPIFCRNPKAFQDTLEIMFRDLPGHGYVLRGDYEIVDASMGSHLTFGIEHGWAAYWKRQNTLIETNRWETKVLPGSRLVMNAIEARNVAYSDSQLLPLPDKRCPRCQAMTYGSKRNGFLNCRVCNLQFQKSVQERYLIGHAEEPIKPYVFGMADYLQMKKAPKPASNGGSSTRESSPPTDTKTDRRMNTTEKTTVSPESYPDEVSALRRVHYFDHKARPNVVIEYADMNTVWKFSRSPLIQAAAQGNSEWISQLLHDGLDASAPDYMGRVPIHLGIRTNALQAAASNGHVAMVKCLLSLGADINAEPAVSGGRTALQAAAEHGDPGLVSLLLSCGADINAGPGEIGGRAAIQAAAGGGHEDVMKSLIAAGADLTAPAGECDGRTVLQAAAEAGHVSIVQWLVSLGVEINAPAMPAGGFTALQLAACNGHRRVVEMLISFGADIDAPPCDDCGLTALQAASKMGHVSVVDLLLQAGADVNAPGANRKGFTAIQAAAHAGSIEVIELLLEHGAEINAPASERLGLTALQAAAEMGHEATVKLLLSHGADVNAPGPTGIGTIPPRGTALFLASLKKHNVISQLLREHGARE